MVATDQTTASWRIRAKLTGIREKVLIGSDLISDELIRLVVAQQPLRFSPVCARKQYLLPHIVEFD